MTGGDTEKYALLRLAQQLRHDRFAEIAQQVMLTHAMRQFGDAEAQMELLVAIPVDHAAAFQGMQDAEDLVLAEAGFAHSLGKREALLFVGKGIQHVDGILDNRDCIIRQARPR